MACIHESGNITALADNNANIYIVDYCLFKFWRLQNFRRASFISFSSYHQEQLLVGKVNGDILVVNFESGLIVQKLQGHTTAVKNVSFSKKYLFLTFSDYEAIVWDLTTNTKLQVLHLEENNALKLVSIYF